MNLSIKVYNIALPELVSTEEWNWDRVTRLLPKFATVLPYYRFPTQEIRTIYNLSSYTPIANIY